ncbi:hypothetical protein CUN38_04920 [Enterococcus faecium]|uniref:hypothetical protein n=1 Tax=Enterococcus faecium TaxID=1352 RepID=UPI000CF09C5D|nr:hypothetical protein [Enterococcus faecium]PQC93486.1 hypothetical protein CUN38_04920 [Enterococcus faecium]
MIMKILLVIAIFIITNHIQKKRYQKRLDNLQFFGMQVETKGKDVEITVATSEGMYQMETDKEMFKKKVKAGLKEEL